MKSEFGRFPGRKPATSAALALCALLVAGQVSLARPSNQPTFPSAEEASRALFLAVQNHNERAVTEILGAGKELASSGDKVQDKLDRERFVQKYQEMHRLAREPDGATVLYIGAENWPFPIPLVSRNGAWQFDSDAGQMEVLFRRIGENEDTAIAASHALVAAEKQPGAHDGTDSPIGALLADVRSDKSPVLFHGYYFRILGGKGENAQAGANNGRSTGGFAFTAYPAAYRSSGVMTFIVNQDDVVYGKDLGPNTAKLARAMTEYHPDPTWTSVGTEP